MNGSRVQIDGTGMGDARGTSWRRAAGALALGHLAAAFGFSASALLLASVFDPATSLPQTAEAGWAFLKAVALAPYMAAMLAIPTFFLMMPASLLTAPFTLFAARRLRARAATALAVGAAIGAVEVAAVLAWDGGFRGPWTRIGLPGDPRSDLLIAACGAGAGMAYAGVVWRLCVRPRLSTAEFILTEAH